MLEHEAIVWVYNYKERLPSEGVQVSRVQTETVSSIHQLHIYKTIFMLVFQSQNDPLTICPTNLSKSYYL